MQRSSTSPAAVRSLGLRGSVGSGASWWHYGDYVLEIYDVSNLKEHGG